MKKKVLVLGGTGMLGHVLYSYLSDLNTYHIINVVYRRALTSDSIICDVKSENELESVIRTASPNVVINCVGALIKESHENKISAIHLNALLPHRLANLCNAINAKLIHISTDCVFSGRTGNYAEDDFRDADDMYGRSKTLGEISEAPHCTLRTSIVGPELKVDGTGLFHWFMTQQNEIYGYRRAVWCGVTTYEMAKQIRKAIDLPLAGLYHVTNGVGINKFDLLTLFQSKFKNDKLKSIKPSDEYVADKSLQTSPRFDFMVPGYDQMMDEMRSYMINNSSLYPHYSL